MNSKSIAKTVAVATALAASTQLIGMPTANATIYRTPVSADSAPQGFVDVTNSLPVNTTVLLYVKGARDPFAIVDLKPGSSQEVYAGARRVNYVVLMGGDQFDSGVVKHVLRRVDPGGKSLR